MSHRYESDPGITSDEQLDRGEQYKVRDILMAIVVLPLTLMRLARALERLNSELAHYNRLPKTLEGVVEVGQDFNEGFYRLFDGRVKYNRDNPGIPQDNISEGVSSKANSTYIPE
ncbi:hypothetical protein HYS91_05520 [Candidatus Daviesbacteria bacterium]|nr:hypothetical protein [Candidatus Daviesbacteria bacterium]